MPPARPLRDVFTDLTGEGATGAGTEPDELLRAQGHEDLGDDLIGEALVNFADSAPFEVAEHLAQFVMAHSPVPMIDPESAAGDLPDWVDLLASAPPVDGVAEIGDDGSAGLDGLDAIGDADDDGTDDGAAAIGHAHDGGFGLDHGLFLDFGHGDFGPADPSHLPGDADNGDADTGDAGIGDAAASDVGELDHDGVFEHDGDVGLTIHDGHLVDVHGLASSLGASIGDALDDADDTGDDGDDADPADSIDS
jgi:hypothetical protein